MNIRPLDSDDIDAFVAIRRAALLDTPLAFAASPEDDIASSPGVIREQLRRAPNYAIFGAFDVHLVGTLGLLRDRHIKWRHKVLLVGMYVAPTHRNRGFATALIDAAIAHARQLEGVTAVHLSVSDATPVARRLYERAGFEVWGSEPDALRYDGKAYIEHHMVLRLRK
jgi:RimJ/RimL family protein N-acetyltransferase